MKLDGGEVDDDMSYDNFQLSFDGHSAEILRQVRAAAASAFASLALPDALLAIDVEAVVRNYNFWTNSLLPGVKPYFDLSEASAAPLVSALAASLPSELGFSCGSRQQMQAVFAADATDGPGPIRDDDGDVIDDSRPISDDDGGVVDGDRIMYGRDGLKVSSHIKFAAANAVGLVVVDGAAEMHKIKRIAPEANLLLQLRRAAAAASDEAELLLRLARSLGLRVVGVAVDAASAAEVAIAAARAAVDRGRELGLEMSVVDIGRVWAGGKGGEDGEVLRWCQSVRRSLKLHFGSSPFGSAHPNSTAQSTPKKGCSVTVLAHFGQELLRSAVFVAARVVAKSISTRRTLVVSEGVFGWLSRPIRGGSGYGRPMPLNGQSASVSAMTSSDNDQSATTTRGRSGYDQPMTLTDEQAEWCGGGGGGRAVAADCQKSDICGPSGDDLDLLCAGVSVADVGVGDWLVFEEPCVHDGGADDESARVRLMQRPRMNKTAWVFGKANGSILTAPTVHDVTNVQPISERFDRDVTNVQPISERFGRDVSFSGFTQENVAKGCGGQTFNKQAAAITLEVSVNEAGVDASAGGGWMRGDDVIGPRRPISDRFDDDVIGRRPIGDGGDDVNGGDVSDDDGWIRGVFADLDQLLRDLWPAKR